MCDIFGLQKNQQFFSAREGMQEVFDIRDMADEYHLRATEKIATHSAMSVLLDEWETLHAMPSPIMDITSECDTISSRSSMTSPTSMSPVSPRQELPTGYSALVTKSVSPLTLKQIMPPPPSPFMKALPRPDTPTPILPPTPSEVHQAKLNVEWELLYKTDECTSYNPVLGCCRYGDKCRFCHPGEARRARPTPEALRVAVKAESWRLAELRDMPKRQRSRRSRRH